MGKITFWLAALSLATLCQTSQAQILVGQTAGFTGTAEAGVREITDGALLYINAVNAQGGVFGQKIQLLSLDDKFDPKLAFENARKLIEEQGVSVMFLSRGTPHTEAIIPLLDKNNIALVAPSSGAMVLHQPVQKNVFNVRATYQREAEKAITQLSTMGLTRIAVVYADDSFGYDGLSGAQKGFARAGLKPALIEKFDRAKPDFSAIAPKLLATQTQAVMMIASAGALLNGLKVFRDAGSSAQIITLSHNASSGFVTSLGSHARGVIVSQVFPSERSIAYPLVKEALGLAQRQGKSEISPAMLEGFAGAKVLVEALRRAGPKPSREKIRLALDGLRHFDLGGLEISYSPSSHTGLDFSDLSIIGPSGKFRR